MSQSFWHRSLRSQFFFFFGTGLLGVRLFGVGIYGVKIFSVIMIRGIVQFYN